MAHDPDAIRDFLAAHDASLAARVKREVTRKLETGLKNPRKGIRADWHAGHTPGTGADLAITISTTHTFRRHR